MSTTVQPSGPHKRVRKLLSLDGGGVRGLSSIMILRALMTHMNHGRSDKVEPWQEFDMIGGTSTGGLLAIMLGRLRMSVVQCEKSYLELSEAIFAPRRNAANVLGRGIDFLKANGRFDESPLKESVKARIADAQMDADELLEDHRPDLCRIFVCATQVADNSPTLLRSYENPEVFGNIPGVKIWEAARATSAASTFFDPIEIGDYGEMFADGALHHNNPIHLVYQEAKELWPEDDYLLVSIGTGSAPGQSINEGLKSVIEQLAKIATETEETAKVFHRTHADMISMNRLFRFNVYHGLGTIGLDESKELHQIASRTRTYLRDPDVVSRAKSCVAAFKSIADVKAPQDNHLAVIKKDAEYDVSTPRSEVSGLLDRLTWFSMVDMARHTLRGHSNFVYCVAFSGDGRLVASGSEDNILKIWDAATGGLRHSLSGHRDAVRGIAFSPDGESIASGSYDKTIRLWNVATGSMLLKLSGHKRVIHSVAFPRDGRVLASGSMDQSIRLWNPVTGDLLAHWTYPYEIYEVAFSPDGAQLACAAEGKILLLDEATGKLWLELIGHTANIYSISFSPDGNIIASGSYDKTVRLWDMATGTLLQEFGGDRNRITSVAFSPDGMLLAVSASRDDVVQLLDTATGALRLTLKGHTRDVNCVAFSPDGKSLVTGSVDKTVRLWDLPTYAFLMNNTAVRSHRRFPSSS